MRIQTPERWGKGDREIYRSIADSALHFFTVFVLGYDRLTLINGFHAETSERIQHITMPHMHLYYAQGFRTIIQSIILPLGKAL